MIFFIEYFLDTCMKFYLLVNDHYSLRVNSMLILHKNIHSLARC